MIDKASVDRIVEAAELSGDDLVLEIGTGLGTLTKEIAERAGRVISVEYDKILFEIAGDILKGHANLELVREDFLKLDLQKILKKNKSFKAYKVVGNLPYYITAPIITKLIETHPKFSLAVFTVQREVGERLIASAGSKDYGTLSIYVQYHCDISISSHIPRSAFYPHPKVSSSVIVMKPRTKPAVEVKDEELFFKLVHAAFGHRRKTLRNSLLLSEKLNRSKEEIDAALERSGINGERRGETLSLEEYAKLSNSL